MGFYTTLKRTSRKPMGDELRQVREMLVFMGQASYFKWFDRKLYADSSDVAGILKAIVPAARTTRRNIAAEEFVAITTMGNERDLRAKGSLTFGAKVA